MVLQPEGIMSFDKVTLYFNHVVRDYSRGDIEALLAADMGKSGPLLSCVVNGIDLLGGMMLGFTVGSRKRSRAFLTKHMGISDQEANLVYSLVRCGVAHEGVAKLAVNYFQYPRRLDRGTILYKNVDHALWLNVTELARLYIEAIDTISANIPFHLSYTPVISKEDETTFLSALGTTRQSIRDFCALETEKIQQSGSGGPQALQTEWLQFTAQHLPKLDE
jgi:hypothetical protein